MAKGPSGRIVIEIDPETKKLLYEALDKEGETLKNWFLKNAEAFLYENVQLGMKFPSAIKAAGASK